MLTTILIIFLASLLILATISYNRLIRDKNRVLAAWSDINVQLARRHQLIPKLIAVVDSYGHYEQQTLTRIIELRTASQNSDRPEQKSLLENRLGDNFRQILLLMENYPDIKTNQQYLSLQDNLSEIENTIQSARRYYNGAVRNLNTRIDSFPDLLIARLLNLKPATFFELQLGPSTH
ncbi:LemA family protein [Methylomarinum sp. Ch1-1]|uniref:LemA family protein n=1 Tax=Methylomarinum roseum TaxID=3067653 RepID=A0AAU7NPP2_9GAMM|nr:LemA family protein [Methylomarinum sp. Ch1-1]MDP4521169.1 LemA family protein [Methylomarinum sp. Ch1-1]